MKGIVVKATGSFYRVRNDDGNLFECRLKGNLRLKDYISTNPVVVGDVVSFSKGLEGDYTIEEIGERKNYIVRRSVKLSKQVHIIAANIDQAILVATLTHPRTHLEFIDRYLVTAGAYHVPVILLFNKTDMLDNKLKAELQEWMELYTTIGYSCHQISLLEMDSMAELKDLFKLKTTLLSGYSGVGKSTLLNRLDPDLKLKTNLVSDSYESGKHSTTFAEMYEIKDVGMVIDTPGIKGLGVIDIPKDEISHYFPEMLELISACKFHNCTHIDEPGCAIKKAVESSAIKLSRYKSYLSIFEEEKQKYR